MRTIPTYRLCTDKVKLFNLEGSGPSFNIFPHGIICMAAATFYDPPLNQNTPTDAGSHNLWPALYIQHSAGIVTYILLLQRQGAIINKYRFFLSFNRVSGYVGRVFSISLAGSGISPHSQQERGESQCPSKSEIP
jgi:hypothetical protein